MLFIFFFVLGIVLSVVLLLSLFGCSQVQVLKVFIVIVGKMGEWLVVFKSIEQQGFEVMGEFDVFGGLCGFVGVVGGQQLVVVYVIVDGKYVLVGSLFDVQGKDIGIELVECLVVVLMFVWQWVKFDVSVWVCDGCVDVLWVVYIFSDVNCLYCYCFWEVVWLWVDSGKVQLCYVMVGVICEDSLVKVVVIFIVLNLSVVLLENEY